MMYSYTIYFLKEKDENTEPLSDKYDYTRQWEYGINVRDGSRRRGWRMLPLKISQ